jgi:hypothetical protein
VPTPKNNPKLLFLKDYRNFTERILKSGKGEAARVFRSYKSVIIKAESNSWTPASGSDEESLK